MTNDEFRALYAMLDSQHRERTDVKLASLHPGGMIMFARKIRAELEQWESEVARRAKAAAENARQTEVCVRSDFGADEYDKLQPDYEHGLDFGGTI